MTSSTQTTVYVVTGSSRGIGLELVRQLSGRDNVLVFATARNPDSAPELKKIQEASSGKVLLVALDVSDEKSVDAAVKEIAAKTSKVDVLINNAGIIQADKETAPGEPTLKIKKTNLLGVFTTNVWGVVYTTQAFFPLLQKAAVEKKDGKDAERDTKSTTVPKVINISSSMGSIGLITEKFAGFGSYRVSKVALNSVTALFAAENQDVSFLALDPGWVDTDMGRSAGSPPLKPDQSVKGILSVIDKQTLATSGHFLAYDGSTKPW